MLQYVATIFLKDHYFFDTFSQQNEFYDYPTFNLKVENYRYIGFREFYKSKDGSIIRDKQSIDLRITINPYLFKLNDLL